MNVFQYTEALDSLLDAHKAGLISNANLSMGTAMVVELFNAQPKEAMSGVTVEAARFVSGKVVYSTESFLASPAFLRIATEDAVKLVAKVNNQSYELTLYALSVMTPSVVTQVAALVIKAASHCAAEANAGRLWKEPK